MSGRRFGVGLAAGVFFALVTIVVSGAVASTSSPLYQSFGHGTAPSAATTATTVITTGTVPGVAFVTGGNQSATVSQTSLKSLSSGSTNAQGSASSPGFSSEVAAMNQLTTPARAVLLAPVVVALLVGALLYRASLARKQEEDD